jgi:hypothetical protein
MEKAFILLLLKIDKTMIGSVYKINDGEYICYTLKWYLHLRWREIGLERWISLSLDDLFQIPPLTLSLR